MTRRFYCVFVCSGILALVIMTGCTGKQPVNPNLMTAPVEYHYPAGADTRIKNLLENEELKEKFIREDINTRYPASQWTGRVKYTGVSYHSIFALDKSTIIFKPKRWDPQTGGLTFSIFHPNGSKLFYTVALKTGGKRINLFKQYYDKETLDTRTLKLNGGIEGPVEIILETKGKGIGAWINPRLSVPREKPRVFVMVVLDTLRYDHTSLYGYSRKTTPVLDELRKESMVYRSAFSTTSWTLPSHVSLFSGKSLHEHGVVTPNDRVSDHYPMLAEVFQRNGYVTAAFTGGGFIEDSYGFARGFQFYSNLPGSVFSKNSAHRVINHFKNYIQRFRGSDLFIFLHTYQIHAPHKAPHEYIDQINPDVEVNLKGIKNHISGNHEYYKEIDEKDRRVMIDLYDASILYCDRVLIGGLVDYLKQENLYDDSMLVVLSDHGEEFNDHGSWEHGHTLYRELIQVPLLIKFPGGGRVGDERRLTSITDIPAIMLRESRLPYDASVFRDGISKKKRVLPVLLPVSPIIQQFPPKISLIDQKHHFIFNIIDKEKQQFFNPAPPRQQEIELYELKDYLEKNDVSKRNSRAVERFGKKMGKYLERIEGIEMGKFKFDKKLELKLKSLGYLGG